jgi:uncharacterized cupredoxin-like copper-binding protein
VKGLRIRWWLLTLAAVGVMVGLFVAVEATAGAGQMDGRVIDATVWDFWVKVSRPEIRAGTVVLRIHNRGPSTHEFYVVRTDTSAGSLPIQSDGLTVDEDAPSLHRVGSIERLSLGATQDLKMTLTPGHYVAYCNLEGHYLGGMYTSFDVTAR